MVAGGGVIRWLSESEAGGHERVITSEQNQGDESEKRLSNGYQDDHEIIRNLNVSDCKVASYGESKVYKMVITHQRSLLDDSGDYRVRLSRTKA